MLCRYPSQWLHSEAANRLFQHAKSRIYRVLPAKTKAVTSPKGSSKSAAAEESEGSEGGKKASSSSLTLQVVLEENPKWRLLREVLEEVRVAAEKEQQAGKGTMAGQAGLTWSIGAKKLFVMVSVLLQPGRRWGVLGCWCWSATTTRARS